MPELISGPGRRRWRRSAALAAGVAALLPAAPAPAAAARPSVGLDTPVTAVDMRQRQANNSPAVAADPTDGRFLAAATRIDSHDFGCALNVSGDRGRTWVPARPVPALPPGAEKCYAPEIAFDRSGRLYYLFVGLAGRGNNPMGVFLTSSTDRARSFSPPRPVLGPGNYQARMALDAAVGRRGRIHVVWLHTTGDASSGLPPGPNPILAAHSDDGGATFSPPVQVSDPGRARPVAPAVALGAGHALHVLYYDLGDDARDYLGLEGPAWEGPWSLVAATSPDGGRSFGPGVVVDDAVAPPERVMLIYTMPPAALAADRRGRLWAAWTDARNGDWDVLARRSLDGGRSFGPPTRLNDDPVGDGRHQYLPRLAVAPDGRLDAVFYDRREDPANVRNDVFYTYSRDGGERFAPNLKLTTASSNTTVGPRYQVASAKGLVEWGSRLALASTSSGAVAAWTDTRNVAGIGDEVAGPSGQDVFAAEVRFGGRRPAPPWGATGAVGLAAAAALGALGLRSRRRPRGRTRRRRAGAAAASALALAASSCGGAAPLPPAASVVHVGMREYRFDAPRRLVGGRLIVRADNRGTLEHQLVLVELPAGFPAAIDDQLRSPERRAVPPVAMVTTRRPGQGGAFAVDLAPGRYGLFCFVHDADGQDHAHKGMTAEIRVR